MNCEQAMSWAGRGPEGQRTEEYGAALEHVAQCPDCRAAQLASRALAEERHRPAPEPPPGALERAVSAAAAAARARPAPRASRSGFWLGMALGGSLAAGLALALFLWAPADRETGVKAPEIALALNETRDVNIAVDAPEALADAEIHVVLTGGIELAGFEGQKELRWRTNLSAGANQLTLPVVALDAMGGQLLVEVQHGDRHRTFVVDVKAKERQPAA